MQNVFGSSLSSSLEGCLSGDGFCVPKLFERSLLQHRTEMVDTEINFAIIHLPVSSLGCAPELV